MTGARGASSSPGRLGTLLSLETWVPLARGRGRGQPCGSLEPSGAVSTRGPAADDPGDPAASPGGSSHYQPRRAAGGHRIRLRLLTLAARQPASKCLVRGDRPALMDRQSKERCVVLEGRNDPERAATERGPGQAWRPPTAQPPDELGPGCRLRLKRATLPVGKLHPMIRPLIGLFCAC